VETCKRAKQQSNSVNYRLVLARAVPAAPAMHVTITAPRNGRMFHGFSRKPSRSRDLITISLPTWRLYVWLANPFIFYFNFRSPWPVVESLRAPKQSRELRSKETKARHPRWPVASSCDLTLHRKAASRHQERKITTSPKKQTHFKMSRDK
jgi:hypothetical protein